MNKTQYVQITRLNRVKEKDYRAMADSMYLQIWTKLNPPQILTDDLTARVHRNLITPADASVPDCISCGACCFALPCVGVRADEKVSADDYWDVTVEGKNGEIVVDRFVKRNGETFACVALDGTIGEDVSCRIYEQRPQVCRGFEAGSDKCHALRRSLGFEPNLSLMEMYWAVQKQKAISEESNASQEIQRVNFVEQRETDNLDMVATMSDGSTKTIYTFNQGQETWQQFEFEGMPLEFAMSYIVERQEERKVK